MDNQLSLLWRYTLRKKALSRKVIQPLSIHQTSRLAQGIRDCNTRVCMLDAGIRAE